MDPYIGEIRIFAGNYAPEEWLLCQGQVLPIIEFQALFAVIGITFGGDGRSTFALPDLRGRAPMGQGQGSGLSLRKLGVACGAAEVSVSDAQMPNHNHQAIGTTNAGTNSSPENGVWAKSVGANLYADDPADTLFNDDVLKPTGGSEPHNNMQPYQGINFIIATNGVFPPHG